MDISFHEAMGLLALALFVIVVGGLVYDVTATRRHNRKRRNVADAAAREAAKMRHPVSRRTDPTRARVLVPAVPSMPEGAAGVEVRPMPVLAVGAPHIESCATPLDDDALLRLDILAASVDDRDEVKRYARWHRVHTLTSTEATR